MMGVRSVCRFFFFLFFACLFFVFMWMSVVAAPFVEKTIVSPLYCLYCSVKDELTIFMWVYFGVLCSVLLIY